MTTGMYGVLLDLLGRQEHSTCRQLTSGIRYFRHLHGHGRTASSVRRRRSIQALKLFSMLLDRSLPYITTFGISNERTCKDSRHVRRRHLPILAQKIAGLLYARPYLLLKCLHTGRIILRLDQHTWWPFLLARHVSSRDARVRTHDIPNGNRGVITGILGCRPESQGRLSQPLVERNRY